MMLNHFSFVEIAQIAPRTKKEKWLSLLYYSNYLSTSRICKKSEILNNKKVFSNCFEDASKKHSILSLPASQVWRQAQFKIQKNLNQIQLRL